MNTETYAFLTMFTIQILAGSVLCPAMFIKLMRADAASFPVERFAELFPGVDKNLSARCFATRYRAQNTAIGVFGLLLLGWLASYMRRPDWNEVKVLLLIAVYFLTQMSPQFLFNRNAARYNLRLRASLADGKRKAILQHRGLFDFVSPLVVFLALASYLLFAALVFYIRQRPFPGSGGFINLGVVTLVYAFSACMVFRILYGRKPNPLATPADRNNAIGLAVKIFVYTCIGATVFTALDLTLGLLHLQRWGLFAVSVFLVIGVISPYMLTAIALRQKKANELGSAGPLTPGAPDLSV